MFNTGQYSKTHKICENYEDVLSCMKDIKDRDFVAIDTETTGLDPYSRHIIGYVFGRLDEHHKALGYYVPIRHIDNPIEGDELDATMKLIGDYFENDLTPKVFFNAKFDLKFLRREGLKVKSQVHDAAALFALSAVPTSNESQALKDICREVLGFKTTGLDLLNQEKRGRYDLVEKYGYAFIKYDILGFYACEDGIMTALLWDWLIANLKGFWQWTGENNGSDTG